MSWRDLGVQRVDFERPGIDTERRVGIAVSDGIETIPGRADGLISWLKRSLQCVKVAGGTKGFDAYV